MGFRISWLATQQPLPTVLAALQFKVTGEAGAYYDFSFSVGALANGWTIVWSEDEEYCSPSLGVALSAESAVLICWVNETVMNSSTRYFDRGRQLWHVWHEGHEDPSHIASEGSPPDTLASLISDARQAQSEDKEVDFLFDVPLNVAEQLCGFKHDDFADEVEFMEIQSTDPDYAPKMRPASGLKTPVKGFWSRIFGR